MYLNWRVVTIDILEAESLLAAVGLKTDACIDETVGIYRDGRLVATGSRHGKVIKCLAVDPGCRGEGLAARIVSDLTDRMAADGIHHQFVFTTPETAELLLGLGFNEVASVPGEVVLLEGGLGSIDDWKSELAAKRLDRDGAAAVVVNCNPMTLGHLHLLETAYQAEKALHVLVVTTERSVFPARVRKAIVEEALSGWSDTVVHEAGEYLVSSVTFPSYFTREEDVALLQARLDVDVFIRHVVPSLGISARYVGTEPYCPITRLYNRAMSEALPEAGVRFVEVPRKEHGADAISASRVREMLRGGAGPEDVRFLVPEATYRFLVSGEGSEVIEKIRRTRGRH